MSTKKEGLILNLHETTYNNNDITKEIISELTPYKSNIDGELSHLRDTYINAEKENVKELLQQDNVRDLIQELNIYTPDCLGECAKEIVNKVEMGLIPYEKMEATETCLFTILAAIQDKILTNDENIITSSRKQKHYNLHR